MIECRDDDFLRMAIEACPVGRTVTLNRAELKRMNELWELEYEDGLDIEGNPIAGKETSNGRIKRRNQIYKCT